MKPRNKREAAVLEMANAMPAMTVKHKEYMKARFEPILYYRMNGSCKCSVCGHEWQEMPSTARYWRNSLYNALGMAEESDAAIIVVSEETGAISLACNGNLYYDLSHDEIKSMLLSLFNNLDVSPIQLEEGRNDAQ